MVRSNAKKVLKDVAKKHGISILHLKDRIRNADRHYRYPSGELRRKKEMAKCP